MRLVVVRDIPPFRALCMRCGVYMDSRNKIFYADLDGKAFNDYYCGECKEELENESHKKDD